MANIFEKMKGDGAQAPERPPLRNILLAWLGGVLAIAAVGLLKENTGSTWVLGSFGASCVLLFGFPDVPFSQPRHIVGGHFLASLTGLAFYHFVGHEWWAMALAAGTAIALMMATRTVHPPAGSNPVIIYLLGADWNFLFYPTLLGALVVLAVGLVYNNLLRSTRYPKYWF